MVQRAEYVVSIRWGLAANAARPLGKRYLGLVSLRVLYLKLLYSALQVLCFYCAFKVLHLNSLTPIRAK